MKKLPTKKRTRVRKKHYGFFEELNDVLNDYLAALNAVKTPIKIQSQQEPSHRLNG